MMSLSSQPSVLPVAAGSGTRIRWGCFLGWLPGPHSTSQKGCSSAAQVIPCFQTWINIVQEPFERFTVELVSELPPRGHIASINSMILCVTCHVSDNAKVRNIKHYGNLKRNVPGNHDIPLIIIQPDISNP